MNKQQAATTILCFFLFSFTLISCIHTVEAAPVTTKANQISRWKALCEQHSSVASYENLGKTILGNDVWLFKIGNVSGGRVLWDGELHGDEDIGAECEWLFANWLLTSGDPKAAMYLRTNYWLVVPVVNYDSTHRMNLRRQYAASEPGGPLAILYGVNLNRNFPIGWGGSGSSNISSSSDYRGLYAGSEPETQAMVNCFTKYKPKLYMNTHMWAGPWIGYLSTGNATFRSMFQTRQQYWFDQLHPTGNQSNGGSTVSLTPYPFGTGLAGGYAAYDAEKRGINSYLIEFDPRAGYTWENRGGELRNAPLWSIEQYWWPKTFPLLLASLDVTAIPVSSNPPVQPKSQLLLLAYENQSGQILPVSAQVSVTYPNGSVVMGQTQYRDNNAPVGFYSVTWSYNAYAAKSLSFSLTSSENAVQSCTFSISSSIVTPNPPTNSTQTNPNQPGGSAPILPSSQDYRYYLLIVAVAVAALVVFKPKKPPKVKVKR